MMTKINKAVNSTFRLLIAACLFVKIAIHHNQKPSPLFPRETRLPLQYPGNPAISLRPVIFRPLLTVNDRLNRARGDRRNGAISKGPKTISNSPFKLVFFTSFLG
jgi:hypothetical protein